MVLELCGGGGADVKHVLVVASQRYTGGYDHARLDTILYMRGGWPGRRQ